MCSSLSLLFVGVFALGLVQAGARHAVYRAGRVPMQKLQLGLGRLVKVYRHVEVRKVPLWPWALPRDEGGSRVARILAIPIGWSAMYAVPTALAFGLTMTAAVPVGPVLASEVRPGSAAEAAGLERGDALLRIDGRAIETGHELSIGLVPGEPTELEIEREGRAITLDVVPDEREGGAVLGVGTARAHGEPRIGDALITAIALPARLAYYAGETIVGMLVPSEHGWVGAMTMSRATGATSPRTVLMGLLYMLSSALALVFLLQLVPVRGFALGEALHARRGRREHRPADRSGVP